MSAPVINTHVSDALARLYAQYASQPQIVALVQALFAPTQLIETMLQSIEPGRALSTAQGAQLDLIGALENLPRNGVDDDTYRALLVGVIGQYNSDATAPSLLQTVQALFLAALVHRIDASSPNRATGRSPHGAMAFEIGSPQLPLPQYPIVQQVLRKALPAGEGLAFLSRFDASGAFAMQGSGPYVRGLADVNGANVNAGTLGDVFLNNVSA